MKIKIFGLSILVTLLVGGALLGRATLQSTDLPNYHQVRERFKISDMVLLDAAGAPIHQWRQKAKERVFPWVELNQISPSLLKAVLKSEDQKFYGHHGVDYEALIASAYQRLAHGSSRGGSTLSMQLLKLISEDKKIFSGWVGKSRQVFAAHELEKTWSKEQILETYLNLISFRGEYRGLGSVSWALFNKKPSGLTLKESTLLAVLIRSPNSEAKLWAERACWQEPSLCADFKTWIAQFPSQQRSLLELNSALHLAQRLSRSGLVGEVQTTLRSDLQSYVQELVRSQIRSLESQNVHDAAVLVIENKTGEVWSYVGGAGLSPETAYVDGVQALRQAGSTLKPFLYATAFEKNILTPDSWIEDSAVDIVFERGVYKPQNHDRKFYGWVPAKTALGSSLNVPAVKVFKLLNDESFWTKLQALHFRDLEEPEHYGPALALGVADVTLEDLTQAYRTLARDGEYSPISFTKAVTDQEERVFSIESAQAVTQILADSQNRSLGFGLESALSVQGTSVKTGTSKDMRDNWCVGYNSKFTVGVWVGNFSGSPMWNVMGITGAAPIWRKVMERLQETDPEPPRVLSQEKQSLVRAPARYPKAQIIYPQDGMVLALDPAIPRAQQKMPLISEAPAGERLMWKINGTKRVPAKKPYLWTPVLGRHKFELFKNGKLAQSVEVLVK